MSSENGKSDVEVQSIESRKKRNLSRAKMQWEFILTGAWTSCLSCMDWQAEKSLCGRFKATPPNEVMVVGCEEWRHWDDIPF